MLGKLFTQIKRPAPAAELVLPRATTPASTPEQAHALAKWLRDDVMPPFPLAELRAHPQRLHAAALMAGGDIQGALAITQQLASSQADSLIDRMLHAEALLRMGDTARAQALAETVSGAANRMGARACALLAEQAYFAGRFLRARELARQALAHAPDSVGAHVVYACTTDALGPQDPAMQAEAMAHYQRALALRLDTPMPRFHLAFSLLRQGRLREGLLEWVMVEILGGIYTNRDLCPVWTGAPLGTQTLLVIAHSGLGDMIHFMRFAIELREREPRARLCLVVNGAVAPLAEETGVFDEVYSDGVGNAAFDCQVTLTHLPLLLDTRIEDLRKREPYLKLPAHAVQAAAHWLPPKLPGQLRVGLRWAGQPGPMQARRDVPLEACRALLATPGIQWVAMVEDERGAAQARQFGLYDCAARIKDLHDTAALLVNLDLLISADTSAANLAGALNLPVWVLSRPDPDWRWGAAGPASPWYGSARVFRHPAGQDMDWNVMLGEVAQALRERADSVS
jgi:tetratricopeptide (TPR) repeat protein